MSGVILPHENFGTHLDRNGKTIDIELEKKNFQFAGEALATIFENAIIDGYPVCAEYVGEDAESDLDFSNTATEEWKMKHVRTSQYFLQIVKCNDRSCCSKPRSAYFDFFKEQFIAAPIPLKYSPTMKVASSSDEFVKFTSLFQSFLNGSGSQTAYDNYCPSVSKVIKERECIDCGLYCASLEMLKKHRKIIHNRIVNTKKKPKKVISKRRNELMVEIDNDVEWMNMDDLDIDQIQVGGTEVSHEQNFHNIISVNKHLEQVWEDE